jgi:thiamine pyrophosphate-dependent acetolactate synthase large subunit-like protein
MYHASLGADPSFPVRYSDRTSRSTLNRNPHLEGTALMRGIEIVAEILQREGTEFLGCFPANPLIEAVAHLGIRPVLCRNERVGVGIADGFSRLVGPARIGVFAMQYGPGAENAFAGVAQAFSDSTPILLLPTGEARHDQGIHPNFSAPRSYATITKWAEQINSADRIPEFMRRAYTLLRSGRPGPVLLEIPLDVAQEDASFSPEDYEPVRLLRSAGDPADVDAVARILLAARRPVLHVGQGVLYAKASDELQELAEWLQIPVTTTLPGKSAFPEDHPLALGAGGNTTTLAAHHLLESADVILGVGCSFSRSLYATPIPPGRTILHITNDPADVNKVHPTTRAIIGDAKLVLQQLMSRIREEVPSQRQGGSLTTEIANLRQQWLAEWHPRLTSDEIPINPYRALAELEKAVGHRDTIITHDAGSPRNELGPLWRASQPRGYIGWGKSTQLGLSLAFAMGAKLAAPTKLVINVMGDGAFGMTGLDFETAVRSQIPILTVVFNNSALASELPTLRYATERFGTQKLSGNISKVAEALGGHAERVEHPGELRDALGRAISAVDGGQAALVEVITCEEIAYSKYREYAD